PLAELLQIGQGGHRLRRLAGDVESQLADLRLAGRRDLDFARLGPHLPSPRGRRASVRSMPRSEKTSSRTWWECDMPRDLSTESPRMRSPSTSTWRSSSQVSISDEMPTWIAAVSPLWVRLVKRRVICCTWRKSIRRSSMDLT